MAILTRPEILLLAGLLALIFVFIKNRWVSNQPIGNEKMTKISEHISKGAMSFLKAEYSVLMIFVIIVGGLLTYLGSTQGETSSAMMPDPNAQEQTGGSLWGGLAAFDDSSGYASF